MIMTKLLDVGALTIFSTCTHSIQGEIITYHWTETVTQHSFGPFSTVESLMKHYNTIKESDREESKKTIVAFTEKYHHLLHTGAMDTVTHVDFKNKRRRLGPGEVY
jgi:hypothetical protein